MITTHQETEPIDIMESETELLNCGMGRRGEERWMRIYPENHIECFGLNSEGELQGMYSILTEENERIFGQFLDGKKIGIWSYFTSNKGNVLDVYYEVYNDDVLDPEVTTHINKQEPKTISEFLEESHIFMPIYLQQEKMRHKLEGDLAIG